MREMESDKYGYDYNMEFTGIVGEKRMQLCNNWPISKQNDEINTLYSLPYFVAD
jgi:hypothetical protein